MKTKDQKREEAYNRLIENAVKYKGVNDENTFIQIENLTRKFPQLKKYCICIYYYSYERYKRSCDSSVVSKNDAKKEQLDVGSNCPRCKKEVLIRVV